MNNKYIEEQKALTKKSITVIREIVQAISNLDISILKWSMEKALTVALSIEKNNKLPLKKALKSKAYTITIPENKQAIEVAKLLRLAIEVGDVMLKIMIIKSKADTNKADKIAKANSDIYLGDCSYRPNN